MKKLLTVLMAIMIAIGTLPAAYAAEESEAPEGTKNVALGKTVFGGMALYGSGDGSALVDGNKSTFTWQEYFEGWTDPIAAFVIDLGEDYKYYDVKQVDITTLAETMWPDCKDLKYTAWFADRYFDLNGHPYYRRSAMGELNGVEIGTVADASEAAAGQVTYKLTIPETIEKKDRKRYVIISHEQGEGITSYLSLAEVSIWAKVETPPVDLSKCTNIAKNKTVYGVKALYGSGEGSALVDEDKTSFVFAADWEGATDPIAAFVIDLGEDYEKYDVKQVDITTLADGMWPNLHKKNWTAWLADDYLYYEGKYYYRRNEMTGIGGVEVGTVQNEDAAEAENRQVTFELPINTKAKKRYVIISHEQGDGVTSFLSLADVSVWAEEDKDAEILANCTNVAKNKKVFGAQSLYGCGDAGALVDGSKTTWTWMTFPEGWSDPMAAFVIDLGEDYENYDIKQIRITTVPDGAWTNRCSLAYTAWLADNYLYDSGKYYYRKNDMNGIGGINVGSITEAESVTDIQTTYKFSINTDQKKRYVIVSHEPHSNPAQTSYLTLAEVEVMAETKITKVDNKNIAPISEISSPTGDARELAKALIDGNEETKYTGTDSVILNFGTEYTILDYEVKGSDNAVVTFSEDGETYDAFEPESYYRYAKIEGAAGASEVRILADPAEYSNNVALDCRFTDSAEIGGNTIVDLKRNVIGAEFNVINLTAVEQEAYAILAKYTANNKLADICVKPVKVAGYANTSVIASVDGDGADAEAKSYVKGMLFKKGTALNMDKYFELIN